MPADWKTSSKAFENLASRSWSRNRALAMGPSSTVKLRATCLNQSSLGKGVMPPRMTLRVCK